MLCFKKIIFCIVTLTTQKYCPAVLYLVISLTFVASSSFPYSVIWTLKYVTILDLYNSKTFDRFRSSLKFCSGISYRLTFFQWPVCRPRKLSDIDRRAMQGEGLAILWAKLEALSTFHIWKFQLLLHKLKMTVLGLNTLFLQLSKFF